MMSFVGMEKYLAIVCNDCITVARGKHGVHQREQAHIKSHDPRFVGNRLRDFNLISPGVFRDDGLEQKLMTVELVKTSLSNIVEITPRGNSDVLCGVTLS